MNSDATNSISTLWPNLRLYAQNCGEIDPYDSSFAPLFRGEGAFAPDVTGWQRWSKPSPEPRLDEEFEAVLFESIAHQGPLVRSLVETLAQNLIAANSRPPVLIAILRAGVPICALLAPLLEAHYKQEIPICAFSLFYGLGWDEAALEKIVADFPDCDLIFVDGWTSGGGVATQLENSLAAWRADGKTDFTNGRDLQFAVLCDPRGKANFSAVQADAFIPSAAFTAPETLGFSRGFAFEDGALFGVYAFPKQYQKSLWIEKWLEILQSAPGVLQAGALPSGVLQRGAGALPAPDGFRVHVNEVTRALINRDPLEIWLGETESAARKSLAPLLYLAEKRGVPVYFERAEVAAWGAVAAARMK